MRISLLALALLALPLSASAQGIIPDLVPYNSWELVGFTAATTTGDMGVLGATAMCHAEFPGARFCTTAEVAATNALYLDGDEEDAWEQPVLAGADLNYDATSGRYGADAWNNQNCRHWSSTAPNFNGMTTSPLGQIAVAIPTPTCDVPRPVSCCKLIPVSEPTSAIGLGAGAATLACMSAASGRVVR